MRHEDMATYRLLRQRGVPVTIILSGKTTADLGTGKISKDDRRFFIPRALVYNMSAAQKVQQNLAYIKSVILVTIRKVDWHRIAHSAEWELVGWVSVNQGTYEIVKTEARANGKVIQLTCRAVNEVQV